jgi:hypothetical protein
MEGGRKESMVEWLQSKYIIGRYENSMMKFIKNCKKEGGEGK